MKFRIFQYPIPAPEELDDLNHYLANHRVATVSHSIVSTERGAMLVVMVETINGAAPAKSAKSVEKKASAPPKIDYREVLSAADFEVFSSLRNKRKELADEEDIPLYSVFSNAHLADMVTSRIITETKLEKLPGIGKRKIEKYASSFLPILHEAFSGELPLATA